MLMMKFFLHHHPHARAIVLSADTLWCTHDAALRPPIDIPFPGWLYSNDRIVYLTHMLNIRAIGRMYPRVMMALGRAKPSNPDGFSDYETGKVWDFRPTAPATAGAIPATSQPIHPDTSLPAIDQLDGLISALPADTAVVIVMPPVFYTYLPVPGSAAAAELGLCKSRLTRSTAGRPHSAFLDFLTDSDVARDPGNFMDVDHMTSNVARSIDDRLAATLVSPER